MSGTENGNEKTFFSVPSAVADFLPSADAESLRVLLFFLCKQGLEGAATALNLSEKQINAALAYWLEKGVLTLASGQLSSAGDTPAERPVKPAEKAPSPSPSETLPKYSGADMERITGENAQLSYLLSSVEKRLGRMLTTAGASTLFGLYDHLGLPIDVILMLVEYCVSNGRGTLRDIEKAGLYWADNRINTHELAEKHIHACEQRNSMQNKIKRLFGIDGRALSKAEKEYVLCWAEEFRFETEVIGEAYERAVKKTGKLSFAYINSILRSWYEKGYRSLADIDKEQKKFTPKVSLTGFDYDEYMRICEERLNKD